MQKQQGFGYRCVTRLEALEASRSDKASAQMTDESEKARLEKIATLLQRFQKQCDLCGHRPANAGAVRFQGNIGLLVRRYRHELKAEMCGPCLHTQFLKFTLMNFILGWWGTISLILTPGYILSNFVEYSQSVVRLYQLRKRKAKALANALEASEPEV
jgi:hypothetical protein